MLRNQIQQFMKKVNTRYLATLERDILIVQTYFGLGTQTYPTYDSVSEECGVSRQRIQQIIANRFFNRIQDGDLNIIKMMSELIEQHEVVYVDDVIEQLRKQGLVNGQVHIRGLFRLIQRLGHCQNYNLYNLGLTQASEMDYLQNEKLLFIKNEIHPEVVEKKRILKSLPGIHGMVNFLDVVSMNSWLQGNNMSLYQSLIVNDKSAKVFYESTDKNNMWYLFEERSNVLMNALGKVLNITDKVQTNILANTVHSDISKRSLQKRIPSVAIIKDYLMNSSYVEIEGEYATIVMEKRDLTTIEQDIYDYFKNNNKTNASFPELNVYLEKMGHEEAYRKQKLYHCPFLYVDKSHGRGNYQLILIDQFSPKDRYQIYKEKLESILETDVTREVKQRQEQSLLRDWLFKDKVTEECAICGRTFSCHSLVAAHKKKRANCTEEERKDPYIVMPACVFGCDHLYENGYFEVHSGHIHTRKTEYLTDAEREYVERWANRAVDSRWLRGSYFSNPCPVTIVSQ